jgi:hypothetical protein
MEAPKELLDAKMPTIMGDQKLIKNTGSARMTIAEEKVDIKLTSKFVITQSKTSPEKKDTPTRYAPEAKVMIGR